MKSKKSMFITLFSVFLFIFSLPLSGSARDWKTGGVANGDTLEHRTLEKWTDLVKEKTNGKIVIDAFPSEQLGPYRDMFDNVVRGVQESGLLPLSPEFDKRLQVGYTVFLAENWEQGREVWSDDGWMFNILKPIFHELGVQPLGVFYGPGWIRLHQRAGCLAI